MTRILLRLAYDVASNAAHVVVVAAHEATGVWLHGAEWREWNKRQQQTFSVQTAASRYERAALERRMRS